jgi:hypothetical protein
VKREGFDEERFLFADLLASADAVTLSYPVWNDAGQPLAPSPLLEGLGEVASPPPAPEAGRMTVRERALRAGLHATREDFEAVLEVALSASGCDDRWPLFRGARPCACEARSRRSAARDAQALPVFGQASRPSDHAAARFMTQLEDLAVPGSRSSSASEVAPPADARSRCWGGEPGSWATGTACW